MSPHGVHACCAQIIHFDVPAADIVDSRHAAQKPHDFHAFSASSLADLIVAALRIDEAIPAQGSTLHSEARLPTPT
jgi:hypothetical protein